MAQKRDFTQKYAKMLYNENSVFALSTPYLAVLETSFKREE